MNEESTKTIVLSFVSGRGGTGKTSIAVACAKLLAEMKKNVVLIDLDLHSRGLTLWFTPLLNLGQVYETVASLEIKSNLKPEDLCIKGELVPILKSDSDGNKRVMFLPAFIPSKNQTNQNAKYPDPPPQEYVGWLRELLEKLKKNQNNPDFILIDCGAGSLNRHISASIVADQVLIVSSPEPDAIAASVFFHREQSLQTHKFNNNAEIRYIVNRTPYPEMEEEFKIMIEKAFDASNKMYMDPEYREPSKTVTSKGELLACIPDLEEFRLKYQNTDNNQHQDFVWSTRKLGGNGFLIAVRYLLSELKIFPLSKAISSTIKEYYPHRGVGRVGLSLFDLIPEFFAILYFILILLFDGSWTLWLAAFCLILFFLATLKLLLDIARSERTFHIYCQALIENEVGNWNNFLIYNEGGNPATLSNIWWPRVAWWGGFIPSALLAFQLLFLDSASDIPNIIAHVVSAFKSEVPLLLEELQSNKSDSFYIILISFLSCLVFFGVTQAKIFGEFWDKTIELIIKKPYKVVRYFCFSVVYMFKDSIFGKNYFKKPP
ncbi:AAA family ATPase [Methyloglobulus sp.]|uniref:AAA family ATPase n=1 Tax=Methyloglobulus sp. TaxID=2518622 RepID=UPI003988ECE4